MKEYDYNPELNLSSLRNNDKIHYFCSECGTECSIYKKRFTELLCSSCKTKKHTIRKPKIKEKKIIDRKKSLETLRKNNLEKYGMEFYFQTLEFQEKRKKTLIEKHGSIKEYYKEQNQKSEKTFKKNHKESKGEFLKNAFQSKYNVNNARDLDFVNQKIKNTCIERYNSESPLGNKEIHKKIINSLYQHHGVKSTFSFSDVRKKSKETMYIRYGVELPGFSPEIMAKAHGKYSYDNKTFDSSWELAYYIWLKDNNVDFKYHPNIKFEFEFENKQHYCMPDFIVNDKIVEIKGKHFLKDDKWINPFATELNDLYETKHQCLLSNNATIIYDCSEYINYVNEKYGKEFLQNCKNKKIQELAEYYSNQPFPYYEITENMSYSESIKAFHKSIYSARKNGKLSPIEVWQNTDLMKEIIKNRLTYNNGIINEITLRRGIDVIRKNPKVSIFSPYLGIRLIQKYLNDVVEIFDPFSGFSGRMIATKHLNKKYIGQDINNEHIEESKQLAKYFNWNVNLTTKDIFESSGEYESLFTCSPYSDKEIWGNETIFKSCDEWIDLCLEKFQCKKYLFIVDNTEKYKDYIVETITNKSHFNKNFEKVILICTQK